MIAEMPPTLAQFGAYQGAYDYFNQTLFNSELRPCILVFQRRSRSYGYFAPERWRAGDSVTHEIALNPDLLERSLEEIFSTLVHEMCHQWQNDYGSPSKGGYHNSEWAQKMIEVGLNPSDTGKPGGKKTGPRMSHYVEGNGPYIKAFEAMPDDLKLPWIARSELKKTSSKTKIKYTCPVCNANAWGKPDMALVCTADGHTAAMVSELDDREPVEPANNKTADKTPVAQPSVLRVDVSTFTNELLTQYRAGRRTGPVTLAEFFHKVPVQSTSTSVWGAIEKILSIFSDLDDSPWGVVHWGSNPWDYVNVKDRWEFLDRYVRPIIERGRPLIAQFDELTDRTD